VGRRLQHFAGFLGALRKAFGWSHSKVSWMPAILVLAGIIARIAAWLLHRIDATIVMAAGAALTGAIFIAASQATTFAELLIGYLPLRVGLAASAWLPAPMVIANWFGQRRHGA
jgi:hypothetical protein